MKELTQEQKENIAHRAGVAGLFVFALFLCATVVTLIMGITLLLKALVIIIMALSVAAAFSFGCWFIYTAVAGLTYSFLNPRQPWEKNND
jgi:uncharacterized membrane protein